MEGVHRRQTLYKVLTEEPNKLQIKFLHSAAKFANFMSLKNFPHCTVYVCTCYNRSNGGDAAWMIYIGSHSGLFLAIDVLSGNTVWQVLLTDRIMSSAALSASGKYVIVG